MMKGLYLVSTAVFWCAVAALWAMSLWLPSNQSQAQAEEKRYTLSEVAVHNRKEDCWMAIGGIVYDLTAYLPQHPTNPEVILPSCGKEATVAYTTKNRGRPHSPYADELLRRYRIGTLAP